MHTFYRIELSLSFSDSMGNHNNIDQTEHKKKSIDEYSNMNIGVFL